MTRIEPLKEFLGSQRLRWFAQVEKMNKEKNLAGALGSSTKIMMKGKKK